MTKKETYELYMGTSDFLTVYYLVKSNEDVLNFISLYYNTLREAHIQQYKIFHKHGDFTMCLN